MIGEQKTQGRQRVGRATVAALLMTIRSFMVATAWGAPAGASLELLQDARSQPLGAGFVALADNAGAMHINPAGLAGLERPELSASYSSHLAGTRMGSLSVAYPGLNIGAIGVGYFNLGMRGINGRDENGNETGQFSTEDRMVALSWSGRLGESNSVGITGKVLDSRLADAKARAQALDLGGLHHFPFAPLSFGLAVRNIGTGLSYGSEVEPLPLTVAAGAVYKIESAATQVLGGVSQSVHKRNVEVSFGIETTVAGLFTLRGSYLVGALQGGAIAPSMTGGFGVRFSNYQIDGSFEPMQDVGNAMKLAFTARFGGSSNDGEPESPSFSGGNDLLNNTRVINGRKARKQRTERDPWAGSRQSW